MDEEHGAVVDVVGPDGPVPAPGEVPDGSVPAPGEVPGALVPAPGEPGLVLPATGEVPGEVLPAPGEVPGEVLPAPGEVPGELVPAPGEVPGGLVPFRPPWAAALAVKGLDAPVAAGAAPGGGEGAKGSPAPLAGAVVAVVPPVEHEPEPVGHCDFFLPCFVVGFEHGAAGPVPVVVAVVVVVVVEDLVFFLLAWVVDVVPDDAAAVDRPGWCTAGRATWLAASAEVNPARPAAAARAPATAKRPMRMRDIGTSLFHSRADGSQRTGLSGAPAAQSTPQGRFGLLHRKGTSCPIRPEIPSRDPNDAADGRVVRVRACDR